MKYKISMLNTIIVSLYLLLLVIVFIILNSSSIDTKQNIFMKQIEEYKSFDKNKLHQYYTEYKLTNNYTLSLNKVNVPDYYNYDITSKSMNMDIQLVNRKYFLSKSYIPNNLIQINNVKIIHRNNEIMLLDKTTYEAYQRLYESMKNNNLDIYIFSAYRSYDKQTTIYNKTKDKSYVASPGHSEHQTGLAIDISTLGAGLTIHFDNTKEFNYLKNNAHLFGFILRYQKNKEGITGYSYEPWHFRYVGIEHAKIIYEQQLTLEEYIYNYIPI